MILRRYTFLAFLEALRCASEKRVLGWVVNVPNPAVVGLQNNMVQDMRP